MIPVTSQQVEWGTFHFGHDVVDELVDGVFGLVAVDLVVAVGVLDETAHLQHLAGRSGNGTHLAALGQQVDDGLVHGAHARRVRDVAQHLNHPARRNPPSSSVWSLPNFIRYSIVYSLQPSWLGLAWVEVGGFFLRLPRPKPTRWCTSARRLPAGKSRRSRRAACALGSVVPAGGKWPHTTEPESTFGPAVQQNVAINQFMRADVLDASPNSVKKKRDLRWNWRLSWRGRRWLRRESSRWSAELGDWRRRADRPVGHQRSTYVTSSANTIADPYKCPKDFVLCPRNQWCISLSTSLFHVMLFF